jgi:DNA mismatch endonuclease, patch repair protein
MSAQRTTGTAPEIALRRALHRRGLRYRLHRRDLPGRPDLALARLRIAVFVDGCFWHSCPAHAVPPKANGAWWKAKLAANVARDQRNDERLRAMGWEPLHIWEHDDVHAVADRLSELWRARHGITATLLAHEDEHP